jgi:hypothetical protein
MATLVGIVSMMVNVAGSFMTDGSWKTAGIGIAQLYWNHVHRSRSSPVPGSVLRPKKPFSLEWSARAA